MTKEIEWAARVDAWRASGVSAAAFCAEQKYSATTLYWWSSRLRRGAGSAEQGKHVRSRHPVRAREPSPPRPVQLARIVRETMVPSAMPSSPLITVQVGQMRVEVATGVDRATLSAVLETLACLGDQR